MINNFISAINIHKGGGLIYFLLLQPNFDKSNFTVLIDYRAKDKIPTFKKAKVIFIKKGLFRNFRVLFSRIENKFSKNISSNIESNNQVKEYFFNGIPPFFRFPFSNKNEVYIFCQNKLVFDKLDIFKYLKQRQFKYIFYLLLVKLLFRIFINRNDILVVQTKSMKKKLENCGFKNKIIRQELIWNINNVSNYKRINNFNKNNLDLQKSKLVNVIKDCFENNLIFFYPAFFYPHKNHLNLLKAFAIVNKTVTRPYKLILTINNSQLNNLEIDHNPNIILLENPLFEEIYMSYKYVDYLIYPSISESYGLPLIEAKLNNIDIIASDLEYVYDVCNPYLVFNPISVEDISNKIKFSLKSNKRFTKK